MSFTPTRRQFAAFLGSVGVMSACRPAPTGAQTGRASGLAGDGRTNDWPKLQAMLDEVERRGKGVVRLPAGTFLLAPEAGSRGLVIPANARLEGAGRDATILRMADGARGHVVSIPFGFGQLADLTVDGNEARRPGMPGHNIRLNGDTILVERVRCINACDYGIAIGQRQFARNVTLRSVDIENTGADGIDIKNDLGQTAGIVLEDITVKDFGRPDPTLRAADIGSREDRSGNKAGIDIRSPVKLKNIAIYGVLANRDGLRFRPGEKGVGHGVGGHDSVAVNVRIRGSANQRAANGIAVMARNVTLQNIDIEGTDSGIMALEGGLKVQGGRIAQPGSASLHIRAGRFTNPTAFEFDGVTFADRTRFELRDFESITFDRCVFDGCESQGTGSLRENSRIKLIACRFDRSCT